MTARADQRFCSPLAADETGVGSLSVEGPPSPKSRRCARPCKCLRRGCACLVGAAFVVFLALVVQLQVDLNSMAILSASELSDLARRPNETSTDVAKRARGKASFAYQWLVHGTPSLLPAAAFVPWMNDTAGYDLHHCNGHELQTLISGSTDAACGPWAEPAAPKGCEAGFYGEDVEPRTAPAGMFAPAGFTCYVACMYGASCTPSLPDEAHAHRCVYEPEKPSHAKVKGYAGVNGTVCPGAAFENLCPERYFCTDPTVPAEPCPRGSYCPLGSNSPRSCPFYATCHNAGLAAPDVSVVAASILLSFFALGYAAVRGSKLVRDALRRARDRQQERIEARIEGILDARAASFGAGFFTTSPSRQREPPSPRSLDAPLAGAPRAPAEPRDERWALPSLPAKRDDDRVDLTFEELGCVVRDSADGKPMRVLSGVTGALRAGRVAAIMGPSGAGKTTLLGVLSGRVARGAEVNGHYTVNGDAAADVRALRPVTGYVPQEDVMCTELTVRENLVFAAATRLPAGLRASARAAVVGDVLEVLQLRAARHRVVGDVLKRGISGGQRKRVNVGMELVADPSLLFADEPTSGLDSATSLDVVGAFHAMAARGAAIAVVLHQPSIQIYRLFDDVLLLAPGGRTAYLGAPERARSWFGGLGFEVPKDWSPPDYYMRLLGGGDPAVQGRDLSAEWARGGRTNGSSAPAGSSPLPQRETPGFLRQLWYQLLRAARQQRRSAGALAGDVATQVIAGGFLGLLYADFSFRNLRLVNFMVSIALGMTTTLAAVPTLSRDRAVFLRECAAFGGGGLSPAAAFAAKMLVDLPRLALLATTFVLAFYPLARPRAGLGTYIFLAVFDAIAASGFGYMAAAVLEASSAQLGALCLALAFAMFSGVHPTITAMPLPLRVVHFASHDRYFVEQLFVEEVSRMSEAFRLPPTFYSDSSSSALAQMLTYGYLVEDPTIYWDHHKLRFVNAATLLAIGLCARLLAFALLIGNSADALGYRLARKRPPRHDFPDRWRFRAGDVA